ncbi:MAG: tonB-system energizer ExbB [Gammaproteobacteria bacterium]
MVGTEPRITVHRAGRRHGCRAPKKLLAFTNRSHYDTQTIYNQDAFPRVKTTPEMPQSALPDPVAIVPQGTQGAIKRNHFNTLKFRMAAAATATLFAPIAQAASALPAIPAHLSVGGMFLQADWVVKLVMIGLLVASLVTWTVFIAKVHELRRATAAERAVHDAVLALRSLNDAHAHPLLAATPLVTEAAAELALSADALADAEGVKERIVSRFERHEAAVARRMTKGVNSLATIGSTAPFVGLFGTVWGIMNSFIGIAEKQTTNLAVVAPGIAEALLATALGLVAAIPAVVIYNHFSRVIAAHRALVADTAAAILRLVSRDFSRGTVRAGQG